MGEQASTIIRELVLKLRNEGKTFSEIGSIKNRSHNTVKKVIDKYEQFGTIEFRPDTGRPNFFWSAFLYNAFDLTGSNEQYVLVF